MKHFALAIDLLGPDADPVLLTELHVWRIRCGIGSQTVLGEARDRGALEELVERIVDTEPGARGRGAGRARAVVLGRLGDGARRRQRASRAMRRWRRTSAATVRSCAR